MAIAMVLLCYVRGLLSPLCIAERDFLSWRREPLTLESTLAYHKLMQIQPLLLSLLLLRRQIGG